MHLRFNPCNFCITSTLIFTTFLTSLVENTRVRNKIKINFSLYEKLLPRANWRHVEISETRDHVAALYLARTWVSSRRCAQSYGVFFLISGPISCEGRALAPGNVTVAFTERFATGFVTSNWRRRYSECTCGTMNSDPPTTRRTPTNTTTTMTITRRGSGGTAHPKGWLYNAHVHEAEERPMSSCWYFCLQSDSDILRRHWHCDQRSAIASHQQRSVTTMANTNCCV